MLPEVPVTVMMYEPGVVPGFAPPPPLPPQPSAPPRTEKNSTSIPGVLHHLRRRTGTPTSKMHARAIPPTNGLKNVLLRFRAEVGAVVLTVSVVVCAVEPLMV